MSMPARIRRPGTAGDGHIHNGLRHPPAPRRSDGRPGRRP
jgi:hypothetical protein